MGSSPLEADLRRTNAYLLATIEELCKELVVVKWKFQGFEKTSPFKN
jgi:hypothetical protein